MRKPILQAACASCAVWAAILLAPEAVFASRASYAATYAAMFAAVLPLVQAIVKGGK